MIPIQQYASWMWIAVAIVWVVTAFSAKKTVKRDRSVGRIAFALIALCGVGVIYFHLGDYPLLDREIIPNLQLRSWTGLVITFLSLSFTVWARINLGKNWSGQVTLKEGHELVTTGAYAITRNPIYTGILFAFLGDAIRLGALRGFIGLLLLLIALLYKISREELMLASYFGEAYTNYKKKVKALIPFIW